MRLMLETNLATIPKGPYIYEVHMEGAGGLEICHAFADFVVFKQ